MDQLFRQEVIDKRKHRLSGVVSLVQPPIFKYLALLLLVMVSISLIFLSMGSYSRKESVTGILQPNTGLLRLSAPQAGLITAVLVQEGQLVKKDQPLLRITSEKHGIEGFELNQSLISQYQFQINTLSQQLVAQKTQQSLESQALNNNLESLIKRLVQIDQQSDIFKQRVKLNQEIVEQVSALAGTGYISDLELKKQRDSLLSLDQQTSALRAERVSINNQISQIRSDLAQLPIEQAKAHDQLNSQVIQIRSQLAAVEQQRLSEVRATASGVVTGLLAKPGKSVASGQNLLSILPQNSVMQAVIYVPTSAFGFVDKGQSTRLRYHAFPYQRFGTHEGEIVEISANVILPSETDIPGLISVPSYRVIARIEAQSIQAYGKSLPLRSGMKLDADIMIEQRSLIRWLFDPIFSIR
ncbi:MAG: membrane fusion protein [Phenylobacterium sp.]